jgi:predicted O-methyltransferase YrrM
VKVTDHIGAAAAGLRTGLSSYRSQVVMRRADPGLRPALDAAAHVDGYTSELELSLLYHLARAADGPGRVIEIGSYLGRSTIVLARAAIDSGREPVVAVDPHTSALGFEGEQVVDTKEQFLSNIREAGVESHVDLRHRTSTDAARDWDGEPVRLHFVDGWHTHEAVLEDVRSWKPFFTDRCCVVFDDYLPIPGVRAGVDELAAAGEIGPARLIVGKMVAFGPADILRAVPAPPGARTLSRVNPKMLDIAVKALAPERQA